MGSGKSGKWQPGDCPTCGKPWDGKEGVTHFLDELSRRVAGWEDRDDVDIVARNETDEVYQSQLGQLRKEVDSLNSNVAKHETEIGEELERRSGWERGRGRRLAVLERTMSKVLTQLPYMDEPAPAVATSYPPLSTWDCPSFFTCGNCAWWAQPSDVDPGYYCFKDINPRPGDDTWFCAEHMLRKEK